VSNFSPTGVAARKRDMRAAVLAARRSLPPTDRQRLDTALAAALAPLIKDKIICGYVPQHGEPGGTALLPVLATAARLLLPVLRDDLDLDWAHYRGELANAARGLREPPGSRLGQDAIAAADLVVVPAVAVDHRGVRLGRGGGSYDRALARASADTLAVVYDTELIDAVPAEPHDRRVTLVLTPGGGVFACRSEP
jgi:5-formyltetrahydrofolate cyclo-ligase